MKFMSTGCFHISLHDLLLMSVLINQETDGGHAYCAVCKLRSVFVMFEIDGLKLLIFKSTFIVINTCSSPFSRKKESRALFLLEIHKDNLSNEEYDKCDHSCIMGFNFKHILRVSSKVDREKALC